MKRCNYFDKKDKKKTLRVQQGNKYQSTWSEN